MTRSWLLALLAAGIWLLSAYGQYRPGALGPGAPATQFSAARADAVLARLLGGQQPHPAGSAQGAAVRARLLTELAALGVAARTQTVMSCTSEKRWRVMPCGTVTNIIARVSPGTGKEILLMAHTDSVAAGPGAADDGSGVATILETIRALKARHVTGHPITALFTDGEENGLLGAVAYLRDPAARAGVGAVINVEARGNRGPSYLFQTSKGDARLIDLYARSVPYLATSSLYGEIYRYLPNDTDLTPFLAAGVAGYNFAFIGNAAHYHTPLDRRENIDPRSLQQHGENALALAGALSHADLAALKDGNAIYLDVLGRWLPRLPQAWALPLSVAAFMLIALAAFLARRGERMGGRPFVAILMPPLLLAGCIGMGFALHGLAAWISGHADPSFAHPVYLRISLAFGAWAVALLAARGMGAASSSSWAWFALLAIACSLLAPGVTPYFLFPSLVAAPLLLATVRGGRVLALFLAALAGMIVWIGLAASGEAIMGLKMHPLFMVSAAFALIALLPLLGAQGRAWRVSVWLSLLVAVAMAAVAGLQPATSSTAPERLNQRYVEAEGKAFWLADPVTHLPERLRAAAGFSAAPRHLVGWGYVAPAGRAQFPPPSAVVVRNDNDVTLDLDAPGDGVTLAVPKEAGLQSLTLDGVTTSAPDGPVSITCGTPDCGHARMTLRLDSSHRAILTLIAWRRGLPPQGEKLLKARAPDAVPSQSGDETLLAARIAVPGR